MRQIAKHTINSKTGISMHDNTETTVPQQLDVVSRANLVQDVIDRIVDRNFGKDYLHDLSILNHHYSIQYHVVNGVRIYTHKKQLNNVTVDEFLAEASDVETIKEYDHENRREIVQDVIDRLIDKNFFADYLNDLRILNKKYDLHYQLENGVRVYKEQTEIATSVACDIDIEIFIALSDGVKEISNFNIKKDDHRINDQDDNKVSQINKTPNVSSTLLLLKSGIHPVLDIIHSTSVFSRFVYENINANARSSKSQSYLHVSKQPSQNESIKIRLSKTDYVKKKLKVLTENTLFS